LESRSVGTKEKMLEPAMFAGLGAVAVWAHVRYPRLRPASLLRAAVHVVVSFLGFALLPTTLAIVQPLVGTYAARVTVVLTLLMATLVYVLLSWVWLLARILHDLLGGTPRGGLPADTRS
jgi:hypothetical protein